MLRGLVLKAVIGISLIAPSMGWAKVTYEAIAPMGGDWVPWPFGAEQAFPWKDIQGLWKAEGEDFTAMYSLRVVVEKDAGIRILKIKQLDPNTCKIVAAGVGTEEGMIVRAMMTGKEGVTFRVTFRAFDIADSPEPLIPGISRNPHDVIVLSISTFDSGQGDAKFVQISKQSKLISSKECLELLEKDKK